MKPLLRRLLLWFALPVLLVALAVWSWTPREPTWEGRSLSEWLEGLEKGDNMTWGAVAEQDEGSANRAFKGMGTNCLPFLLRRLDGLKFTPLEKQLFKLDYELRSHAIAIPWDRGDAGRSKRVYGLRNAFEILGHQAAPAVPELQRCLLSSELILREEAAQLLARIHPEGTAALIAASTNRLIIDRSDVLEALHGSAPKYPEALSAYLGMSADRDPDIRGRLGKLLTESTLNAAAIWPVLNRLLADPDDYVRRAVVSGLESYKGNLHPAEPALTALSADLDPKFRRRVTDLLDRIKASSATPPPAP